MISRDGASCSEELCVWDKPSILVPSPNVAEDHQTKNALALSENAAAIFVKDIDAEKELVDVAIETLKNDKKLNELSENVKKMAYYDAADKIAEIVLKTANCK